MFSIKTDIPGLTLVLAEPRYANELFSLIEENRGFLKQWLGWLDQVRSVEDSRAFLQGSQRGYASHDQMNTLIFLQGELIGTVGFNSLCYANHEGELGYWLSKRHTGNGYMRSAVSQLLKVGFNQLNLNRIVLKADTRNINSRAVANRLNFKHEGIARKASNLYGDYFDLDIYSLLKTEW